MPQILTTGLDYDLGVSDAMSRGALVRWGLSGMMAACLLVGMVGVEAGMTTESFIQYRSTNDSLPVSFEYPRGWDVEESSGTHEIYTQIQIYAPKAVEGRLRTYLIVRAMPTAAEGGRFANAQEAVTQYQQTLMPTMSIARTQDTQLLGREATQVEVTGTLRLPWKSPTAEEVPVIGQRVFFEASGRLYELAWLATPESAEQVSAAFGRLVHTLAVTP